MSHSHEQINAKIHDISLKKNSALEMH